MAGGQRERADVVVVGAGIVGCGAAFRLARRGVDVTVVDKGRIAHEQSSRNWGWVRQNGRNLREVPAAVASRRLWSELESDVGEDVGWHSAGNLHLAYCDRDLRHFERWRSAAAARGLETEMVSAADVAALAPGLDDDSVGGIFCPLDGQADPHRAAPALAAAAEGLGVRIREGVAVTGFLAGADGLRGVATEAGEVEAECVIVAAGAWSSRLLWQLGLRLPQRKIRATVSATVPLPVGTRVVVWARDVAMRQDHRGSYVLAAGGGRIPVDLEVLRFHRRFADAHLDTGRRLETELELAVGDELERDLESLLSADPAALWRQVRAEEPAPDPASVERALAAFRAVLPGFGDATTERSWSGFIDYTPDAIPVIDAPTSHPGLVIATGFSGHGFALGPIGGLLASQLAMGEATEVDVRDFRLSRFVEGDTAERELHF
ncbi:MAG: FAD-binding oxidoreductase [Thermoanaerobaculia bacterium]|nr:FAD-binding oxidoreductase [Thermoanaerobaculia bacterium]